VEHLGCHLVLLTTKILTTKCELNNPLRGQNGSCSFGRHSKGGLKPRLGSLSLSRRTQHQARAGGLGPGPAAQQPPRCRLAPLVLPSEHTPHPRAHHGQRRRDTTPAAPRPPHRNPQPNQKTTVPSVPPPPWVVGAGSGRVPGPKFAAGTGAAAAAGAAGGLLGHREGQKPVGFCPLGGAHQSAWSP
jgi:hypothetical protein